eukprot:356808-Chlamydomonas_euryale.AAC.3
MTAPLAGGISATPSRLPSAIQSVVPSPAAHAPLQHTVLQTAFVPASSSQHCSALQRPQQPRTNSPVVGDGHSFGPPFLYEARQIIPAHGQPASSTLAL